MSKPVRTKAVKWLLKIEGPMVNKYCQRLIVAAYKAGHREGAKKRKSK